MNSDDTDGQWVQHHRTYAIPFRLFDLFGIGRPALWGRRAAPGKNPSSLAWLCPLLWKIIVADSTPGHARGLLRAWTGWERLSEMLWPTTTVPDAPHGLLRIRIERYRRSPITLAEAVEVRRGVLVGDIHFDNRVSLRLALSRGNPFAAFRDDLRCLAKWMQLSPIGRRVIALHASTILAKGGSRFGFTLVDRPITIRRRMEKIYFTGLLLLYSRDGLHRLRYGTTARVYPRDIWITRHELLRLHAASGNRDSGGAERARFGRQDSRARSARRSSSVS